MNTKTIPEETRAALEKILRVLEVFRVGDRDMPIGEAVSFIQVALGDTRDGGISITELAKAGGFALASASRYIQALGEFDRRRDPGLEWVSDNVDLMERRRKVLKVTPKGKRILSLLQHSIGA